MLKTLGECIERQLENPGFAEARGEGEDEPMPCAHGLQAFCWTRLKTIIHWKGAP